MKKKNNRAMKKSMEAAKIWREDKNNSDVLGSYTGNPEEKNVKPQQDADDL